MTNIQLGKVKRLLTIAGLSFDDIARLTGAPREEVKKVAYANQTPKARRRAELTLTLSRKLVL
jgi:hypothetical protein